MDSLPEDLREVGKQSQSHQDLFVDLLFFHKQQITDAEKFLLSQEVTIPVYFTTQSPELDDIFSNIKESTLKDSAGSAAQGTTIVLMTHLHHVS